MKVLHVIDSLGSGGAERSLSELLPGLLQRGISSEVAVFHLHDNDFTRAAIDAGAPVHFLTNGGRCRRLVALRRLVRGRRPDILHTTLFEADVLGRVSGLGLGIPVVTSLINTAYGSHREDDPGVGASKLELVRRIDGFTARHLGAGFHAITRAVSDDAVATMGLDPADITVIPRGRDTTRLGRFDEERHRRVRRRFGVDDATFLIVNVGRQEYQKGQSTLLEAVARLRSAGVDLTVLIAGRDGNETARLHRLVDEHGLDPCVRFLGLVDDVPDLLVAADVLAFPSRFEGMAGTIVEALALETPIVASDVPALREVLDDGRYGTLVPVDDPTALAAALDDARRAPDAARARARAGRDAFLRDYTIDTVTDAMAAWFRDVHAAHASGGAGGADGPLAASSPHHTRRG